MKFFRKHSMFISMLIGWAIGGLEVLGYFPWRAPKGLLPTLIFLMLFFTFLRISPRSLRMRPWHLMLLVIQVVASVGIFVILSGYDVTLAQGTALCVLMPAATAAPIIAGKIGGSVTSLTPFTLFSSVTSAFIIPMIFPFWNPDAHIAFWDCFLMILRRVAPMLVLPALVAWTLRRAYHLLIAVRPKAGEVNFSAFNDLPFWLWMITLIILMAQMIVALSQYDGSMQILLWMTVGAFATCLMQFFGGKYVGAKMGDHASSLNGVQAITAGQALGQKNTTLGIWLAQTYLNPISSLAPAAYIVAQNLFNSWQLARAQEKNEQK